MREWNQMIIAVGLIHLLSSDSKSIVSISEDNFIRLWDIKTGRIKSKYKTNKDVKQICFSSNGTTIAKQSGKFLCLWNLKTGKQMSGLLGHTNQICSVASVLMELHWNQLLIFILLLLAIILQLEKNQKQKTPDQKKIDFL
ncbi:unnamed protein product [Paramecium octaurelia]|uniref:Uncharacterized protein n=1 Tax=Paramecium octaurelia TaxID=43137 RepID=A0A8S1SM21_PAROT|nr:unnamed protein product [Paramecium octaurelia]